jgi:glutathione peroxidase
VFIDRTGGGHDHRRRRGLERQSGNCGKRRDNITAPPVATGVRRTRGAESTMAHDEVWGFEAQSIDGKRVKLSQHKGKVLLIVNTASRCGFTPQFDGLEALWQAYKDQGLVVLGFPSNEFGGQDPGSNEEIASFCQLNFGVSFPMMAKTEVNGARAHPLYQWLTREAPGLMGSTGIKWNFTKFLVGRDGRTIKRYAPQDEPAKLVKDIEAALAG